MDVLDHHPLLRLSLPAALHQHVHLVGTRARPFQLPALRDAFNGLSEGGGEARLAWFNGSARVTFQLQTVVILTLHPENVPVLCEDSAFPLRNL